MKKGILLIAGSLIVSIISAQIPQEKRLQLESRLPQERVLNQQRTLQQKRALQLSPVKRSEQVRAEPDPKVSARKYAEMLSKKGNPAVMKGTQAFMYKLDSIIFGLPDDSPAGTSGEWGEKETYEYDEMGNLTGYEYFWDNEGLWENVQKGVYTYDLNGNLLTREHNYWDGTTWIKSFKGEYAYNVGGFLLSYTEYQWDWDKEDWRLTYKTENTYGANDMQTAWEQFRYNCYVEAWLVNEMIAFSYNAQSLNSETSYSYWEACNFVNYAMEINEYDDAGNLTTTADQFLDYYTQEWFTDMYHDYEYDENGNRISYTTYYANEGVRSEIDVHVDYEYYEGTPFKSAELFSWYDYYEEMLIPGEKEVYYQDLAVGEDQVMMPTFFSYVSFKGKRDKTEYYWHDTYTSAFEDDPNWVDAFFYSEIEGATGTKSPDTEDENISVFPNPANDLIHVKYSQELGDLNYKMYDLRGQAVQMGILENKQILTERLVPGTYVLELLDSEKSISRHRIIRE